MIEQTRRLSPVAHGTINTMVIGNYCASHKNWIRNIRFSIINRPLSQ